MNGLYHQMFHQFSQQVFHIPERIQPVCFGVHKMECKPFSTDNQKIMDYRLTDGLCLELPSSIDLTNCQLPSAKAGSYLRNRCMHLGIALEGVE